MDNTENNNNTELQNEKTPEDKKERTFFSKLGVFALYLVGISIIIGLIVLVIKVWKLFFKFSMPTLSISEFPPCFAWPG